jgi:hypothetical protein
MISNPNPDTGVYSTEFADESSEYFDAYAEVQTRYSQVDLPCSLSSSSPVALALSARCALSLCR